MVVGIPILLDWQMASEEDDDIKACSLYSDVSNKTLAAIALCCAVVFFAPTSGSVWNLSEQQRVLSANADPSRTTVFEYDLVNEMSVAPGSDWPPAD